MRWAVSMTLHNLLTLKCYFIQCLYLLTQSHNTAPENTTRWIELLTIVIKMRYKRVFELKYYLLSYDMNSEYMFSDLICLGQTLVGDTVLDLHD